ncbi:hypothetical protein BSKO_05956 [Bryopsis sp. KO-2023]|nr:hypothetical protein BSKO_05956 [Bryopsis sp. KO-2023]
MGVSFVPACVILALVAAHSAQSQSDVIPPGFSGPIEPKKTAGIVEPPAVPAEVQSETAELEAEEPSEVASVQETKPEEAEGTDRSSVESTSESCPDIGSDVTEALKAAVLNMDINCAGDILSESGDIWGLAKGFRFDPEKKNELLAKTEDRNEDPDVIVMKAISKSALDTRDAAKLAAVMVVSTLDRRDDALEKALQGDLSDLELMSAILNADANKEFVPDVEGLSTGQRRAILMLASRQLLCDGCTPANSLVCGNCWASDVCSKFFWCS